MRKQRSRAVQIIFERCVMQRGKTMLTSNIHLSAMAN
jgi:hypothetical protein